VREREMRGERGGGVSFQEGKMRGEEGGMVPAADAPHDLAHGILVVREREE
jgi:hypothetical protein